MALKNIVGYDESGFPNPSSLGTSNGIPTLISPPSSYSQDYNPQRIDSRPSGLARGHGSAPDF
jgi:hypothetical protein